MEIYLKNTLSGEKELFTPLVPGQVGMYNCGPTVYDHAHIGNLRSYVFADVLRRMFEWNGYAVKQVVNITDIGHLSGDSDDGEDKMTKALKREGKPLTLEAMREVADFYFDRFREDLTALNIQLPQHFPFASDHITEDVALVQTLLDRGFAYTTSDGIYFDTAQFPGYGALGQTSSSEVAESRIGTNSEKKSQRDFALWKFSDDMGYDAPFDGVIRKGFPGWHIECSAMSVRYLGPEFDIHTGGIDHIPVHHNNEIAQSVCAGYPYARYWMHNAFLNTGADKMAKSAGNFITLQTLKEKGINPLALRYFYLTARYSSPMDFSWEALQGAETGWKRMKKQVQKLSKETFTDSSPVLDGYMDIFTERINDDLDTPSTLALIWDILKVDDDSLHPARKHALITKFDEVLGLGLSEADEVVEIPKEIQKLVDERDTARANKDWARSDTLREQIETLGYSVKDSEDGSEVQKI